MHTRNKEDTPTRNFKKKKKQEHPKLKTDDFPHGTKTNKKKTKKKKTKKNEKQQQKKKKQKKNPSETSRKTFKCPAELTSEIQNGRGISFSKTLSTHFFTSQLAK